MTNPNYELHQQAIQALANRLTKQFDLKPVTVVIDGRLQKRYGSAYYATRKLLLSPKLLNFPDDLNNTLRHEVAHFLCWDRYRVHGHGRLWKQCAIALGARPAAYEPWRYGDSAALNGTRYQYECGSGCVAPAARIRPRYETGLCARHGLPYKRITL